MSDLISRQDAIDIAMEELDGGTPYDIPGKIDGMPSAQPRNGKWIDGMCTECGESTQGFLTNFCPNCGADMRGGEEC